MQLKKFLIKSTKYYLLVYLLLASSLLEANPWLDNAGDATISFSAFFLPNLSLSAYKGYVQYGILDNFNVELMSTHEPKKDLFRNKLLLKVKLSENYYDNFQHIMSVQLSTQNVVIDKKFEFIDNSAALLIGIKLNNIFMTLEPIINTNLSSEIDLSIGSDYSEYSTLLFTKTFSSFDERWRIYFVKNIIENLDMALEYSHHVKVEDKFSVGLWYKLML